MQHSQYTRDGRATSKVLVLEASEFESDEEYDSEEDAHCVAHGHEAQDDEIEGDDDFDAENEDYDPTVIVDLNQMGKLEHRLEHE